ncbi:hypothetical protein ACFSTC_12650 [Nonomuraea ferruginea]
MKTLGKIALAVLGLLMAAVWLVILRLKDVPPVALVTYGAVLVAFLGGVLWPGRLGRRRALLFLGVPAGLGTLALYFAVVFYVTDAPVLLGAVAVACLLAALAGGVRRGRGGAGPSRRALLTGGAGILLGALAGLSTGPVARHRSEIEARWRRETQAALRAPGGGGPSPTAGCGCSRCTSATRSCRTASSTADSTGGRGSPVTSARWWTRRRSRCRSTRT